MQFFHISLTFHVNVFGFWFTSSLGFVNLIFKLT